MKKLFTLFFAMLLLALNSYGQSWSYSLTTDDGLPGEKTLSYYKYATQVFYLDEAATTLRITVISTPEVDLVGSNTSAGLSAGSGPGFPYFGISELKVFDAEGNSVSYIATTNALENAEGLIANLNDDKISTFFHSVWSSTGDCPQAYHYLELELAESLSSFQLEWTTREGNLKNPPSHVGITPGTLYLPYPEMKMNVEGQVTELSQLAAEGELFLIKGNVESYSYNDTRTFDGGGYFHSPYGAAVEASADDLVYLVPVGEDNTYKVKWLMNNHYIGTCAGSAWLQWTSKETEAGNVQFIPCDSVQGDFTLKMAGYRDADNAEYVIAQDGIIKMRTIKDGFKPATGERPLSTHFSIYSATVKGETLKPQLQSVIESAGDRLELYGGKMKDDRGEYDVLVSEIEYAKGLIASSSTTSSQVISEINKLQNNLLAYSILKLYAFTDSIEDILDNDAIEFSTAPNWISGSFPMGLKATLQEASEKAMASADDAILLSDIDAAISTIESVIQKFWDSKIGNVVSLPIRMNTEVNGLPGVKDGTNFVWESQVIYLDEEIDMLRFTVFATNTGGDLGGFVYPTLGEFILLDAAGKKIELTESNFTTNSLATGDGDGILGLCDDDWKTAYVAAWSGSHELKHDTYVYLEVALPEPISAFKYRQIGRSNGANTPSDFVLGKANVAVTPGDVPAPDPWNGMLGTKITDVSQIQEGELYALYGNLGVHPQYGWEPYKGSFYKGDAPTYFSSDCAFVLEAGENGKFYVKSIFDNRYWAQSNTMGTAVVPTFFKSEAAEFNITPSNNEAIPDAFRFWYPHESDPTQVYVYQSWESGIGSYAISSDFSNDDPDGQSEWNIYRMTMDTPYQFWLLSIVKVIKDMGFIESSDPGFYKNLGTLPTAMSAAQEAIDNNDFSNAKAMVNAIGESMQSLNNLEVNPIIDGGVYVMENSMIEFFTKQGVYKAINTRVDGDEDLLVWGDENKEDTSFWFTVAKSTDYETLGSLVEAGTITKEDSTNAYTIRNVKNNLYIDNVNDTGVISLNTTSQTYIFKLLGMGRYSITLPNKEETNGIHTQSHSSGVGLSGRLVYWYPTSEASQWYLRSVGTTSIEDLNIEGDDEVIGVTYYTISGTTSSSPINGINIEKTIFTSGKVKTRKILYKK